MSAQDERGREPPKPKGKVRGGAGGATPPGAGETPKPREGDLESWGSEGFSGWGGRALRALAKFLLLSQAGLGWPVRVSAPSPLCPGPSLSLSFPIRETEALWGRVLKTQRTNSCAGEAGCICPVPRPGS